MVRSGLAARARSLLGRLSPPMAERLSVVVLAAGKGTRMRNPLPKVLHPLAGRSLIGHVLEAARALGAARTVVVLAPDMEEVAAQVRRSPLEPAVAIQEPQLGTGHALQAALPELPDEGTVLVLYGDTPLMTPETLGRLVAAREAADAAVAVLGMRPPNPAGYGRLRFSGDNLAEIVEERHADAELRRTGISNSGVMAMDAARLRGLLDAVPLRPEKGEYYLTDIVALATARGWRCTAVEGPWEEGVGVNSQAQLADATRLLQARLRGRMLEAGVIMPAPETVHLAADTEVGTRRGGRALRCVRARRAGRGRGGRPQLQPPRGGDRGGRGQRRPVRAAAARHAGGCEGAGRQLRRDQEREPRGRGQGQPPDLSRRRQRRRGGERRRRHHHLQL